MRSCWLVNHHSVGMHMCSYVKCNVMGIILAEYTVVSVELVSSFRSSMMFMEYYFSRV